MKLRYTVIAFILGLVGIAQTMTVNRTGNFNDPFWLASNVLVDSNFVIYQPFGPGGLPLNQPPTNQVGIFKVTNNVGLNAFPIDSGIVMCANWVEDVLPGQTGQNPNTTTNPKDPDLLGVMSLIGSSSYDINDMVEIQFSFVATGDSIQFNYVFGSHEYAGYTCSQFNDVFGFFLEGNGINGNPNNSQVNLATIPGTSVPVAINTINQGFPSSPGNASYCLNANPNYVLHSAWYAGNNPAISLTGNTKKFTAKAQVTCGNAYTIKLKLANASDHALSSAVFLEANSFTSPTIDIAANLNSGNSFVDSQLVEGCKPSYMTFEKNGNINKDMTIKFNYTGNAIMGVDYAPLPDSLFIPAGVAKDSLKFEVYDDGINEPNDSIIVDMQPVLTVCAAYPGARNVIYLRDKTPVTATSVNVTGSDTIYCPGDTVRLQAAFQDGEGLLHGWWVDDTLAPLNRLVQPAQTTTYHFYATDECGSDTAKDSVTIYLVDYVPMTLIGDTIKICRGDTVGMLARYEDGKSPYDVIWDDGTLGDFKQAVPQQDSTWHVFTVSDACLQSKSDSVLVWMAPDPVAGYTYMNDPGVPLKVNFTNNSVNAMTYLWDFGDGTTSNDTTPSHTYDSPAEYIVTLTITSPDGCIDSYTNIVKVETDFYLYVPTAFTPDGDGINEELTVKGTGFESYEIHIFNRWGGEVFHSEDIEVSWDGTYQGKAAPQGVYTYTIFIQMPLGDISEKKGTFTLYR
ncbi:MAG: choice-of-anchor L domain-containing protein [Schleiferiaceae bacterium]|jgi:gliding motility-associated-like protein|nr:choice-of-anchor L domain-containing protein [Schleiferiaceae bacterium]